MDIESDTPTLSQPISPTNINQTNDNKEKISEKRYNDIIDNRNTKETVEELTNKNQVSYKFANTNNDMNPYISIPFTLEDIFVNLTLIARIDVGNKLVRYDKYVNIDTSYFQSITRWFNGQNRSDNLKFTSAVLLKAFEYSDNLTRQKDDESRHNLIRLNTSLTNVINGLSNLSQTYYYDKLAQSEIEVMINNIRTKLNIQSKHIQFVEENKDVSSNLKENVAENKKDMMTELKHAVIESIKKDKKDDKRDNKKDDKRDDNNRRESEKSDKRDDDNHSHSSHLSQSSHQSSHQSHTTNPSHSSHLKKKSL